MKELEHPNILKHLDFKQNLKLSNASKFEFCLLELELAEIDLFDFMDKTYPAKLPLSFIKGTF